MRINIGASTKVARRWLFDQGIAVQKRDVGKNGSERVQRLERRKVGSILISRSEGVKSENTTKL